MPNFSRGEHTETAGTEILEFITPVPGHIPNIEHLIYTAAATEHTATVMRVIGMTEFTSQTQAGSTILNVKDASPGLTAAINPVDEVLASGDFICWETNFGFIEGGKVSSVSANAITIGSAITYDTAVTGKVWAFYEPGRSTHIQFKLPANTRTEIDAKFTGGVPTQQGIGWSRNGVNEPLLFHVDNITNAGTLELLWGNYLESSNYVAG
jgi:hypothetical protein